MKKKRFIALIKTVMRITISQAVFAVLFTCTTFASDASAQEVLDKKISVSIDHAEIQFILKQIQKQADVKFIYSPSAIKGDRKTSVHVNEMRLGEILEKILKPLDIGYAVKNGRIVLFMQYVKKTYESGPLEIESTLAIVRGKVINEEGAGLPGVSVVVKGTTTGTTSDLEGNYSLDVPEGAEALVFSFIGYVTEEVTINNQSTINVSLIQDVRVLSEVVVVGYGTQKREDVVGSFTSVSEESFRAQPVNRIDQALQGRAAGVQVTNAGGAPGGDVRIRIRGANSLAGDNEPLYVVDGFVGADFATVNPQDIADIQVLKDASATSIYGSRGANGVIIITTKSGKSGEMSLDFGARFYSSQAIKKHNTLNAAEFAEVANERKRATTAVGQPFQPIFTEEEIAEFQRTGGTDWQEEIFRTAPGQEYQLSVSGGNDKTNYLVSGNFLDQKGIIKNSDFKRYSIRANLGSQLTEKLSMRLNFTGSRRENLNTGGTGQRSGALAQALAWAPTTPVRDANGILTFKDPIGSLFSNPVGIIEQTENRSERNNVNLVGGLRYEFLPGLTLDVQLGVNYLNRQEKRFSGRYVTLNVAGAGRTSADDISLQNINTLNYTKTFNDVHAFDFTAVFETQKFTGSSFHVNANNLTFPSETFNNVALSESAQVGSGYASWALLSTIGRINYSFKEKYLLSTTLRRDGSSKFQGDNKYSVFPSIGLGWRVSEEAFLKGLDAVTNLKVRGSWGLTGNQGIGPYGTLSRYDTHPDNAGQVFSGESKSIQPGVILGNPGNASLKWETTEQINIGVDLGILQNRASLSADYFVKDTRDLLMFLGLPDYAGGYEIMSNVGNLQNKGWELTLDVTPVKQGSFEWSSNINFSVLKNEMISLGGERDTIIFKNSPNVLIPGQSMSSFWGLNYLGTWKANEADEATLYGLNAGDAKYEDLDGNRIYNEKDFQIIGNGIPKTTVGWNNTFSLGNLSLNVFFQGMFGFDKFNYTYANGMLGSTDARQITFADIRNRYIPGENETSDIPAFSSAAANQLVQTSRFVEKGDFVRLKNVSLYYDIPKAALRNIAGIRVFVSATNLLTFTKYKGLDPESNSSAVGGLTWDNFVTDVAQGVDYGSYPNSKTYTVGFNLSF